ncbi:hypothetical protein ACQKPE_12930, partial [Pseudomonas sp. NPDC089554]|uniref:hypothetical protein n=1 Tax=Pseudomonas sp. NPDC089554 TaxID=3390653 RepID=UPI003D0286A0
GLRGLRLASQVYISRLRLRRRALRAMALQTPALGLLEVAKIKIKIKIKIKSESSCYALVGASTGPGLQPYDT